MCHCCEKCFSNSYIQTFIKSHGNVGDCDYCNSRNVYVTSIDTLGFFFRECFDKAYEYIEEGTGAYYDSEEKEYCGPNGEEATRYSVLDILEKEYAFDDISNTALIEDIMNASSPSIRDIQNGETDPYSDIYDDCYTVKNDLYGVYATKTYHTWEQFKFIVKHYNRFFDVDGYLNNLDLRKQLLDQIRPFIMEYEAIIPSNEVFYRARKKEPTLDFDNLIINKELSPAPAKYAQTNRMSPSGISYLYLASSPDTACAECRYTNEDVILATFFTKSELQIIDFSQNASMPSDSIFSQEYDHDNYWVNNFLKLLKKEISLPIDSEKNDHSYEYVATQLIAEYIRSIGYDGIGFNSSVSDGKSYCFFCGPDLNYCKYDYGIFDDFTYNYDFLPSFLESFEIEKISLLHVSKSGKLQDLNKTRKNNVNTLDQ